MKTSMALAAMLAFASGAMYLSGSNGGVTPAVHHGAAAAAALGGSDSEAVTPHCPLYLYAVMNGVYYYYCEVCGGECGAPAGASDTAAHSIGGGCENCPQGSPMCEDPINVARVQIASKANEPALPTQVFVPAGRLPQHAGPRRGTPASPGPQGSSEVAHGKLVLTSADARHLPDSDSVVRAVDGDGTTRYFRVFAVQVRYEGRRINTFFGQQLESAHGFGTRAGTLRTGGDATNHFLTIDDENPALGRVYHVISKDQLTKP